MKAGSTRRDLSRGVFPEGWRQDRAAAGEGEKEKMNVRSIYWGGQRRIHDCVDPVDQFL